MLHSWTLVETIKDQPSMIQHLQGASHGCVTETQLMLPRLLRKLQVTAGQRPTEVSSAAEVVGSSPSLSFPALLG